jgi:hypothetical protein
MSEGSLQTNDHDHNQVPPADDTGPENHNGLQAANVNDNGNDNDPNRNDNDNADGNPPNGNGNGNAPDGNGDGNGDGDDNNDGVDRNNNILPLPDNIGGGSRSFLENIGIVTREIPPASTIFSVLLVCSGLSQLISQFTNVSTFFTCLLIRAR